ncbi:M28 family peptidase [Hymenobacter chitinivorans]|uniref:Peptidase M28-like protein n=1 Tax=Hymenobacter chitinivorans DSM 11115 TaxID=1121954 RepID=A0A2M9BLX8_9BACT|nr:M28 family peptidase [Hymenobacter chitinivorans]PJJ58948.1 peptidase M28-like protein [Hymenobacter chitinivorans DSM 11115]
MKLQEIVKVLDDQPNATRRALIIEHLDALDVRYVEQPYASGNNLVVDLGRTKGKIGVGSHFDRVLTSAGANDNGSAIAVCLDVIRKHQEARSSAGLRVFFFDEEETGLKGSHAYVAHYGTMNLAGLLNLELVGMGDKLALWPVDTSHRGSLLSTFEAVARRQGVSTNRFGQLITNTADHVPFRQAGLRDAFTITCITDQDIAVAQHYFQAIEQQADIWALREILAQAPLFRHYHQPTDTYEKLSEAALAMTSAAVWETVLAAQ